MENKKGVFLNNKKTFLIDVFNIDCNLYEILTSIAPMKQHRPKHCNLGKKIKYDT